MSRFLPMLGAGAMALLIGGVPLLYHRYHLTSEKRFRSVEPGRVYRSGQMTVVGFEDTIRRHGIRTVINVQNEYPDPNLRKGFLNPRTEKESEVCRRAGARYIFLDPDLVPRGETPERLPGVIAEFLEIMDNPANYPVLIHCKAGLHRTGCLVAVYRMEYQGWSAFDAIEEMKDQGFGDSACTSANDYIAQYVLAYRRRPEPREVRP